MFCTACGNVITPEQAVCSKCGNPTSVGIMYGTPGRRILEHYYVLGILHIVYSSFIAVAGIGVLFLGKVLFPWIMQMNPHNPPPAFIIPILQFVAWLLLIRGGAGVAAGVGLIQRAPWARVFALVMGFISLLSIPVGTALGIYTIWVLMSPGAEQEYARLTLQPR